jgi:hypothetical protein
MTRGLGEADSWSEGNSRSGVAGVYSGDLASFPRRIPESPANGVSGFPTRFFDVRLVV